MDRVYILLFHLNFSDRFIGYKYISEIRILKKVRGDKKILGVLLDIIKERINGCNDQIVAISHADDLQRALDVKEIIQHNL